VERLGTPLHPQALLLHNARVYLACRSEIKVQAAISELKDITGKEALFLQLDLADLKSVKAAANDFLRYTCLFYIYKLSLAERMDVLQQGNRTARSV
jgi:hypothetical protein